MTEIEKLLLEQLSKLSTEYVMEVRELKEIYAKSIDRELSVIDSRIDTALKLQNERLDGLEKLVSDIANLPNQLKTELERLRIEQEKTTELLKGTSI